MHIIIGNYNTRKIVKEYYDKSKKDSNIEMTEKYYNKMNELKELKKLKIKQNRIKSYNNELSLLKQKQKCLYDELNMNYIEQKNKLDFKYETKIEQIEKNNKKEIVDINNNNLIKNKSIKNKEILILEEKKKYCIKLNLYNKAEITNNEIKQEKNKLLKEQLKEDLKNKKLKINNLKIKQNKRKNIILMHYDKEKNDLEIKYQKEKNELLNKFKNQIIQYKNINNKNQKYEDIKYLSNSNYKEKFNKSFDKKNLDKKVEEDESSISFTI